MRLTIIVVLIIVGYGCTPELKISNTGGYLLTKTYNGGFQGEVGDCGAQKQIFARATTHCINMDSNFTVLGAIVTVKKVESNVGGGGLCGMNVCPQGMNGRVTSFKTTIEFTCGAQQDGTNSVVQSTVADCD